MYAAQAADMEQHANDDLRQDLVQHATAVRDALQGLHEVWSFSLTEASDIMHDPSVNESYPFGHDLDEVVQMAGEWVEALKGGADGQ